LGRKATTTRLRFLSDTERKRLDLEKGSVKPAEIDRRRRDVLRFGGVLGLAALTGLAGVRTEPSVEEFGRAVRAATELKGKKAADIFKVKDTFKRFDVRKTSFARSSSDRNSIAYMALAKYTLTFEERVRRGEVGFGLEDYALTNAGRTVCMYTASGFGNRDSGLYSWYPLGVAKVPSGVAPLRRPPDEMSRIVKKAARTLGADLVGICELDERWVYANDERGRPFVFEDVEDPYSTETKVVIPSSFRYVVVIATKMDFDNIRYAPYGTSFVTAYKGYDEMAIVAARVAEFIRGLGYKAIPCGNDTALSIPLAIDAGLGQYGRICRLVTPEYGPNVRLSKVLTNLPMEHDNPIDFGLTDFCNSCKKCVDACPVQALPSGDPAWEGPTESEIKDVYKWQQFSDRCLKWWGEVGTGCAICFRACPWTNGIARNNETVKYLIKNFPALDGLWRPLDDFSGNGRLIDPIKYWESS